MSAWDNLSIREKAAMMRTAVSNGITNIDDIKREYNEFAEGGPIEENTFTSELDWSPKSWFSKRVAKPDGTYYNEEEAARLASHVPEYLAIEENAKNNGTWLQNSDGSKWEGDPRSWVMMQSEAYKKNYSAKPWYTGQAEWPTKFDYGQGTIETNKVTRAPYYNEQMWFSDNKDYGDTFANYQNSKGTDWRFDTPGEEDVKGQNFLTAIPKKGNYRYLEKPSNSNPDNWQHMPFSLENNTINRLPAEQIILDSKGRNMRADKQKVLTDDVVNWSKSLGDQGIFMYNVDDGDIIKDGYITPQPVNEFISQPGFTDKVKFIEGNTGDFDINNPYKYAYVPTAQKSGFNIAALGGNLFAGGGIYIKPSHRGRLTELKARTGKTEAELYNDGNPAHKKMVVFARNARKWHDLGGNLFDTGDPTEEDVERLFWENKIDAAKAALEQVNKNKPKKAPTPIIDKQLPELLVFPERNYPDPYSIPQGEITPATGNALTRAINNYIGELKYDLTNNRVPSGKYLLPATVLGAAGLSSLASLPAIGEAYYAAGLSPLVMEGLAAPYTAHGLDNLVHGNADWQTALEIAPLTGYAKPIWNAGKAAYNTGKTALYNYRNPFGEAVVPINYSKVIPKNITKIGDVEINNPNLLYHLDRGDKVGAFSSRGAYVKDGKLFPGEAKNTGETAYSWWNKGKPYAESINGQLMTRLMTATEDTPNMLHVRSQNYRIGQWTGKNGLVRKSEYVNPTGVDVSNSTYTFDPNYGWRKVSPNQKERASLAFYERPQSRISAEERAGLSRYDRKPNSHNPIPITLVNRSNDFIPVENGNFVFGDPAQTKKLASVHFTQHAPVTANSGGNWDSMSTTLLMPYGNMRKAAAPISIEPGDTFFPNYHGLKASTKGSKVYTGDKAIYDYYTKNGVEAIYDEDLAKMIDEWKSLDAQREAALAKNGYIPDEKVDQLDEVIRDLENKLYDKHLSFTEANRMPTTLEDMRKLDKIEGLKSNVKPIGRNDVSDSTQKKLGFRWFDSPPTHSNIIQEPQYILKYPEKYPKRVVDYARWIDENAADFRNPTPQITTENAAIAKFEIPSFNANGGRLYDDGGKKKPLHPNVGRAMQYFMDKGFTDYQAAGLVGNLMRESSMSPTARNKWSGAYGLAQWLGDRKTNLFKKYGNNPTFEQQLDYVWDELNSTHKNGLKMLKASKSAEEAARNAMGYYEFSAGPEKAIANMVKHGQDGEDSMRKGVNFAMGIMGRNSAEYVPQMQLPPNYNIPQNWELPAPQYTLDELAASGTMMPAKELPLTTRIPSSGERPNALLDLLAQYQYLDSLLSQ